MPRFAYYYPEPYWRPVEADRIKELLLFFEGIAILLPNYMYGRHRQDFPELVVPMEDQGYLRILAPEEFIDQKMTDDLCNTLMDLLKDGTFDTLSRPPEEAMYQELSRSRLGRNANVELSEKVIEELRSERLALPSENALSVRLHPAIRTTVLVLLSQLAPKAGRSLGLDLQPVTWDTDRLRDLGHFLNRPSLPSSGHVVAMDVETMILDVSTRSLDEILEFKGEHGNEYRAYMRDVRKCVMDASRLDAEDRDQLLADRKEALVDEAARIRRAVGPRWKQWSKVIVGGAGVAWDAAKDPVSAGLHRLEQAVSGAPEPRPDAFSYLLATEATFG